MSDDSGNIVNQESTVRFFVTEYKHIARDSIRIIEVQFKQNKILILRGKTCQVLHEVPFKQIEANHEDVDLVITANTPEKALKLHFGCSSLKRDFLNFISQAVVDSPRSFSYFHTEHMEKVTLMAGESILLKVKSSGVSCAQRPLVHSCVLIFTNARIFCCVKQDEDSPSIFRCIAFSVISYFSIAEVEIKGDRPVFFVSVKDGREIIFHLDNVDSGLRGQMSKIIDDRAFLSNIEDGFAMAHFRHIQNMRPYDEHLVHCLTYHPSIEQEYSRLGFNSNDKWRLSKANQDFALCSSYPACIAVPKTVPDSLLGDCAHYRSQSRLPVACWMAHDGCVILRSSQPRPGWRGARSSPDETVLREARLTNAHSSTLVIFDLRSKIDVIGNQFKGKGGEIMGNYPSCPVIYMGMKNIHGIRPSFQAVTEMCRNPCDTTWFERLDASRWFHHIRELLNVAIRVAQAIVQDKASVLIHCSDGWDRTSQVSSLSQLLLDPFYRTLDGFTMLIQKEWMEFGHPFSLRHAGIGNSRRHSSKSSTESAPIFILFLDAVHQLLRQKPEVFEINCNLLCFLARESHNDRFGNFLCDNPQQRAQLGVQQTTLSIWQYIKNNRIDFVEPSYRPTPDPVYRRFITIIRRILLWEEYFCKYDPSFE
uniref:Myotubularin phosphatase domain-containing protein n=2 Tax=Spongospora subterranea TaxID=70186 RepID=A0A0H5R6Y6_9EUKA|eukprot:CRZ09517.1 hypothetical protein [Spongospora subterranea]